MFHPLGCAVELRGWSVTHEMRDILVNGIRTDFYNLNRGLRVLSLNVTDTTCFINQSMTFDTYVDVAEAEALVSFVESLPNGTIFIAASAGDIYTYMGSAADALARNGVHLHDLANREAIAFIARKGEPNYAKLIRDVYNAALPHLVMEILPFLKGKYTLVSSD